MAKFKPDSARWFFSGSAGTQDFLVGRWSAMWRERKRSRGSVSWLIGCMAACSSGWWFYWPWLDGICGGGDGKGIKSWRWRYDGPTGRLYGCVQQRLVMHEVAILSMEERRQGRIEKKGNMAMRFFD
ncbi:hypothetical protein FXO38_28993 [Capsicum annuum]|nr:hypothetical protein FXO38_28993 [Capsicum annuum]KAF3637248.1 hypothetical protein FXO37_25010 [Capsicum annuum]